MSTGRTTCTTAALAADVTSYALKRIIPYELPEWAKNRLRNEPTSGRIPLANLPTPLYQVHHHRSPPITASSGCIDSEGSILGKLAQNGISLYVKRDDMSGGVELGGNKIRKLEFLLADALKKGCDSVVTIGGEQSNHCRATAAAARMVGLEPHLILRTSRAQSVQEGKEEFGLTGNILFDRIVGSSIYTCTPGEYGRVGSDELVRRLCAYLESAPGGNKKPLGIPVGGSNALGSYGYVHAVDELMSQWQSYHSDHEQDIDAIVFACGSGGTAAGICVGIALAYGALETTGNNPHIPTVHAIGVCDSPDYFYEFVAKIADDMGISLPDGVSTEEFIRGIMVVHQGKGLGYALSTEEELNFVGQFARETGVALDPVYSGKSLFAFCNFMQCDDADSFRGKNVLFWHTGGALGLYDKGGDLLMKLRLQSPVRRLDVYGRSMAGAVDI